MAVGAGADRADFPSMATGIRPVPSHAARIHRPSARAKAAGSSLANTRSNGSGLGMPWASGRYPDRLAEVAVAARRRFEAAAADRAAGADHGHALTAGQRYVIRELRAAADAADPVARDRTEDLAAVFRGPLPQAVTRELARVRRDATTGPGLVRVLARLVREFGLGDRPPSRGVEVAPRLVCSVAFVLTVELLNTAIEKLADRLTLDHDKQIGRVKDMGSAAVGVALLMAGAFWIIAIVERLGFL